MTNKEELFQQKYMEFQHLQQQMQQINEHIELLHQQNQELEISKNAITEIAKTEVNNEILAPVANGIFIKAELKDNKKLVVNVGSNTTVERTVPEVVELLDEQLNKISAKVMEAEEVMQQLNQQAMKIYEEAENVRQTEG